MVFFILMMPPPPTSTLFPYTTLFRSHRPGAAPQQDVVAVAVDGDHVAGRGYRHQDRKSTRLNSSHVRTSYAVFCLKKKNIRSKFSYMRSWRSILEEMSLCEVRFCNCH